MDLKARGYKMIYDANVDDSNIFSGTIYDVCVIGAGAAGITIANELGKAGKKIALCEAGAAEFTEESQENYKGEVTGDPYFDLDVARLRFLGGTTNHWSGMCRSFDEADFDRTYLGNKYKWPIEYKEILRYRKEACNILEIKDDFEYNDIERSNIKRIKFQFSPSVRFKGKYELQISKSTNISLLINANLVDIDGDDGVVKVAYFRNYMNQKFSIKATKFIFAMGGIENSRYLLWFAQKYRAKYFDTSTPIGKYWMEHPHFTLGSALVDKSVSSNRFYSLTHEAQKKSQILNCGFRLTELSHQGTKAMIRELLCVAPKLGWKVAALAGKNLICGVKFRAVWEQAPVASNAVTLANDVGRFGIPSVNLKWSKNNLDRKTVKESVRFFNNWLLKNDTGRIQLNEWMVDDTDYPTNDELAGCHHMGGTRMSNSSQLGVVDKNCKVYGSSNLYIAGSSIFTTGGHNNPTLPIVQFSLRLSDYLKK
jgi:hypothetical protein